MVVVRAFGLYLAALLAALVLSTLRLAELALGAAPFALWLPFIRPLLSAAFEASLVLGVPLAWLFAWCRAEERRPARRVLAGAALALVAVSVGGATLMDVGQQAPGKLAQELIDTGRASCAAAVGRRVAVPLVNVAWGCPPNVKPVVTGNAHGLAGVVFSATALSVSEDLRQFELADLILELPARRGRIGARIAAGRAKIRGLPPWGRPRHVPLPVRLTASLLGMLTTVASCSLVFRMTRRALWPVLLAGIGGIALLAVQQLLDRLQAGALGYFAVAPVGAAVVATVFGAAWLAGWAFRRWRPERPMVRR